MAKNKIAVSARIKCLNQIHKIGLTRRGQLIFFNHTFDELKQFEQLAQLGGSSCKCLTVYEEWRMSEFAQTPEILTQQRLKRAKPDLIKIAWRAQKRMARLRPREELGLPSNWPGRKESEDLRKTRGALADAVAGILNSRGYAAKTSEYGYIGLPKSLPLKQMGYHHPQSHCGDDYADYVEIRLHGGGYLITTDILNYHATVCHIGKDAKPEVVYYIADYIERLCLFNRLRAAADRNYKRDKKYLADLCDRGKKVFDLENRDNTLALDRNSDDQATYQLQLQLTGLTYQGAMQILRQYHTVTGQIERIRVASKRRTETDQRWPPLPKQGIGRFGNQHSGGYSE